MGDVAGESRDGGWELSAEAALRDFTPRCPQCGYDLMGLPAEDQCPECGTFFSLPALLANEIARRRELAEVSARGPSHFSLVLVLLLSVFPLLWAAESGIQTWVCLLIGVLTVYWMIAHRRVLFGSGALMSLWLIIPLVRIAIPVAFVVDGFLTGVATLSIAAMIIAHSARRDASRTFATFAIALLAPGLAAGGIMLIGGLIGLAAGGYWSWWDYPYWESWPPAWRPPVRAIPNDLLLRIGASIFGAWLVLLLLAVLAYRSLLRATAPLSTSSVLHDEPERE